MRIITLLLVISFGCAGEEEDPYPPAGPTGPQPTNTPILSAAGGTACIGQSTLCVHFPAGSLSDDVTVTIRQASGYPLPAAVLGASAFDILFTPDTTTFSGTATLTYQLSSAALVGHNLAIRYADTDTWAANGISNQAHTGGATLDVVSADTNHFTAFAVVDVDALVACACDVDATCTNGCACDADCCACDVDATCTNGCGCDADCCACDTDATCTNGCACDLDCLANDEPDIAVAYAAYEGPNPLTDCSAGVCTIPVGNALDVGAAAPGSQSSVQLTIANRAACTGNCDACMITVAPDPGHHNLGLDFIYNQSEAFAFMGSTMTPFDIRQESAGCMETGEVNLIVTFTAPMTPGGYTAAIAIESNDPDEPVIEIPVVGMSAAGPTAIADFRACPDTFCTDPSNIAPSTTVYLDGTASTGTITSWDWQVLSYPPGVNPAELSPNGADQPYFDFVVPSEGLYDVQLTVYDGAIPSADTVDAHVQVVALSDADVQIILTWDADVDLDLHLTYFEGADLLCHHTFDCFYSNKSPLWFSTFPAGSGPNPHMDMDDSGFGPENTFIDQPNDGTYIIYVHYYDASGGPTTAHLVAVVDGTSYTFNRSINPGEVWAVASVWWNTIGVAQEYPTDGLGLGAVATMPPGACIDAGWDFP